MQIFKKDLEIILQEGEDQTIEFKESFTLAISKEIVAMANTIGGKIFLGIDDNNIKKRIEVTNDLKSKIIDLAKNCDPSIPVNLQVLENILIIDIPTGLNKPYQCKDGFFLRQGTNSQKLTRDKIIEFLQNEKQIKFDSQINKDFSYPKDFNKEAWKEYIEAVGIHSKSKTEDILINLGIAQLNHGKLLFNNAGVLFFAKNLDKFFRHSYIDMVVFKGTDRVDVIDRKIFNNGLFENFNKARIYLKEHLNVRYEYRDDWKRENIYELPLDALREAVANAFMHRDYFITGANICVSIFDDRVEITSPGRLPKPLTKKDLGKLSIRRNEIIADLFSRLEYIEKLGTGIKKMKGWMKEYKLNPPKIEATGIFTITFYRHVAKNVGKMSLKNVPKKERQEYILNKILSKESFTFITIAKELSVHDKTIERDIEDLKQQKIIKFVGSKRSGYYAIIKK